MTTQRRPRLLQDKTKQDEVIEALELGCSLTGAAKLVNCSPSTIRREAQLDPEFKERFEKTRGQSEVGYLRQLHDAAKKPQYWRAAAWALERRFPKHYAARSPDVITLSQITILIAKIARILEEEIPAPSIRKKILKRLDSITADLHKEQQSTSLPGPATTPPQKNPKPRTLNPDNTQRCLPNPNGSPTGCAASS